MEIPPPPPPPKKKKKQNRTFSQEQLAQVCSQIVLFSCLLILFADNTMKLMVSTKTKTQKQNIQMLNVKTGPSISKKTGPSMLRNKIGPMFNL